MYPFILNRSDLERLKESVVPQSGEQTEPGRTAMDALDQSKSENVTFSDQDAGWMAVTESQPDSTFDDVATSDTDLGSFLSRPVIIFQDLWGVGTQFDFKLNPWAEFFADPAVINKIANFALIRCKMKIKVVISGTGFHYGRCIVSYNPLAQANNFEPATYGFHDLMLLSQRQHIFLNPALNEGGELCLPYFFPTNYFSIYNKSWEVAGELVMKSFDVLKHANGGDDPVTVTMYAWAEDVSLTMPTSQVTPEFLATPAVRDYDLFKKWSVQPQAGKRSRNKGNSGAINSGDEYGQGIISKPASAIANVAGMLAKAPVIGPYARATEMAAGAVGRIASMFGYSRPAVLAPAMPYKPTVCGNLANTSGEDSVMRLTMDPKQELTVDPRVVGLSGDDELDLVSMSMRESFLTSFNWSPDDQAQRTLWCTRVHANNFISIFGKYYLTPAALVASHFQFWKGSIKYRFQIVKSNFHKGRLAIRYDPIAHDSGLDFNTAYHRVVDISETDDFEVIVGWGQEAPMLRCSEYIDNEVPFSAIRLPRDESQSYNGILEIDVLNQLVSPSVDAAISVNVFVSCCDDIKWGKPDGERYADFSLFPEVVPVSTLDTRKETVVPQSGETDRGNTDKPHGSQEIDTIAETGEPSDAFYQVFMGEKVTSLRELFKRYYYEKSYSWSVYIEDIDLFRYWRPILLDFHLRRGWDTIAGVDESEVDQNVKLNSCGPSPVALWSACFAAWRGSLRRKYMLENSPNSRLFIVTRLGRDYNQSVGKDQVGLINDLGGTTKMKYLTLARGREASAGCAATMSEQNNVIEVEFPFYQPNRFNNPRIREVESDFHRFELLIGDKATQTATQSDAPISFGDTAPIVSTFTSVGEDFSLFGFTGVPVLFRYSLAYNS